MSNLWMAEPIDTFIALPWMMAHISLGFKALHSHSDMALKAAKDTHTKVDSSSLSIRLIPSLLPSAFCGFVGFVYSVCWRWSCCWCRERVFF